MSRSDQEVAGSIPAQGAVSGVFMAGYDKLLNFSMNRFDIAKLKNWCNEKLCKNKPEKEFGIFEYSMNKKREILTVYLCDEHFLKMRGFLKDLRDLAPNMILEKKVKNIENFD